MMKTLAGMLAVAVAVGMGGPVARAQPGKPAPAVVAKPTKSQLAQAKKHYDLGEAYKNLQKYVEAEAEYLEAYRLSGRPFLLFNAGLVRWLAGDRDAAVARFREYVAKDPDGDQVGVAKGYIEEVEAAARAKVEAERARVEAERKAREDAERERREAAEARAKAAAAAKAEAESKRQQEAAAAAKAEAEARARAEAEAKARAEAEAKAREEEERRDAATRPGRGLRRGGLVVAGGGVAALVAGGLFGVKARGIAEEMENTMWSSEREARDAEGRAANRNMVIGYSVGAAAVVTGGVLYYLGVRTLRESVSVTPVVNGEAVGLTVEGRF